MPSPAGPRDRRTTFYEELDWWQRNRPNNPPILLDTDRVSASALTGSDPRFSGWSKAVLVESAWEEWRSAGIETASQKSNRGFARSFAIPSALMGTISTCRGPKAQAPRQKDYVLLAAVLIDHTAIAIGVLARQLNRTLESSERRIRGLPQCRHNGIECRGSRSRRPDRLERVSGATPRLRNGDT